jgi:hypothetical protein
MDAEDAAATRGTAAGRRTRAATGRSGAAARTAAARTAAAAGAHRRRPAVEAQDRAALRGREVAPDGASGALGCEQHGERGDDHAGREGKPG